ncbi:MAG: DUF4493 domain-containing protein [Muribaculaceae bacterium]|nr:DUF4493 domain-containing protein [Muribaculaceae bacterium]
MKKLILFLIPWLYLGLWGCNSDEPETATATGLLIVHLQQDDNPDVDFSDYAVAIIPKSGFIPSAPMKDIEWPVEVYAGTYTIAAASPMVAETETTESWYYGEVKNVRISQDQTTEVTISLTLTDYPKQD